MKRRELFAFAAQLAKESPTSPAYSIADVAESLCRIGRALDGLAVADCNGELTDKQIARRERLKRGALNNCQLLGPGFSPVFQGDPRGCVLKIALPSGWTNDGAREGYCVPYWV